MKKRVYILGDFYEAWIGTTFPADWNTQVEKSLATLSHLALPYISLQMVIGISQIGSAWLD